MARSVATVTTAARQKDSNLTRGLSPKGRRAPTPLGTDRDYGPQDAPEFWRPDEVPGLQADNPDTAHLPPDKARRQFDRERANQEWELGHDVTED